MSTLHQRVEQAVPVEQGVLVASSQMPLLRRLFDRIPGPLTLAVSLLLTFGACARDPLAEASDEQLVERFEQLHRSIYQVFGLAPDAASVRDHLARSFAGEELTDEFLEHYTTLALMARDRTAVDVLRVDYEGVSIRRVPGRGTTGSVEVDADWTVGGVVTHQGHRHPRINRYRATYRLASAADLSGGGALESLRIVDTRLDVLERIRGLGDLTGELSVERPTSGAGTLSLGDLLRSGVVELPSKEGGDREKEDEAEKQSSAGSSPP